MRGDIGRHTDGNTHGAVDQQVREAAGQHGRLISRIIEVRHHIDDIFLDVGHHFVRDLREFCLGVTVCSRAVTVYVTEVTLSFDERIAIGEVLRHAHHRAVHGGVAVRMVATEHVTDRRRRLAERLVVSEVILVHCVEDTTLSRLHTVADIGQCTAGDNAHRIFDEALAHLLFHIHGYYFLIRKLDGFA